VDFEEGVRRFEEFKKSDPILASVEVVHIGTAETLERFEVEGAVCQLGSKFYGEDTSIVEKRRRFYADRGHEYVGLDIEEGIDVDVVADLCHPRFQESYPELVGAFAMVISGALLEHVKDPVAAARNIVAMLAPGGLLYFNGPWVQGFHEYPDDFWRISISGIKELFQGLEWLDWCYSGCNGKWGIRVPYPRLERALFLVQNGDRENPRNVSELLSDRALTYLMINAWGRKPV